MSFEPDYTHMIAAATNRKPTRLPLYEHIISDVVIDAVTGRSEPRPDSDSAADLTDYYRNYCRFWRDMTYDTVSWEGVVTDILPDHGALMGGRPGPIQNRDDFEKYPFDEIPALYWRRWAPHLDALARTMPPGMKAVGGVGNGPFEISEDLVGYEYLCLLQFDDPDLFADLYATIGNLMTTIWSSMIERYGHLFAVCRMGDDLGYKTSTLLAPDTIVTHILPQYDRIISLVRHAEKPFLLHSCGNIFPLMDAMIGAGIDAKHSNEDQIAPFQRWIDDYGDRIGLFGGIDVDLLTSEDPKTIFEEVVRRGTSWREAANGFALGSGNSIPEYVPVENYRAMIEAANEIRRREAGATRR